MFQNDYNAICFGTIGSGNLNDPRLNYTADDWDTYEAKQTSAKHESISLNMKNLLANNGIELNSKKHF